MRAEFFTNRFSSCCCLNLLLTFQRATQGSSPSILVSGSPTQNERLPYNAESPSTKTDIRNGTSSSFPRNENRPSFRVSLPITFPIFPAHTNSCTTVFPAAFRTFPSILYSFCPTAANVTRRNKNTLHFFIVFVFYQSNKNRINKLKVGKI